MDKRQWMCLEAAPVLETAIFPVVKSFPGPLPCLKNADVFGVRFFRRIRHGSFRTLK